MSSMNNNNNFTQIQSRRFRSTINFPCYKLCPSMDLIVLGQSSTANMIDNTAGVGAVGSTNNNIADSIIVHRIISWSNLLTIKIDCLSSGNSRSFGTTEGGSSSGGICVEDIERECIHDYNDMDEEEEDEDLLVKGATFVTWSPNGRYVAIGLVDGGVLIHTVEPDAAAEAGSKESLSISAAGGSGGGDGSDGNVALHIIKPPPFNSSNKPSILSPTYASSSATVVAAGGGDINSKNKKPTPSPRVTRSMAAAREGTSSSSAAAGSSGISKKKSRRSKSPHSRGSSYKPNLKVDVKHSLQSTAVIGMTWNRLSPSCHLFSKNNNNDSANEEEQEEVRETWKYSSQLIDRGGYFLPSQSTSRPAASSGMNGSGSSTSSMNLFSSMAQLNVLCVATPEEIHWYLQGQYRILSIGHGLENVSFVNGGSGIDMVCSPDLSTLLVVAKQDTVLGVVASSASPPSSSKKGRGSKEAAQQHGLMKAKLFGTPLLPQKRFELQILSASYKSIFSHLWDARKGIQSALTSWKSALRPLDTKFNGLLTLLSKYNVDAMAGTDGSDNGGSSDLIRLEFLRFILSGRSTYGNSSSALDQFFTRAQMHDQLLQREARGIEASVASMEGVLRSQVLSSIRAVVYEAEELYGLAKAQQSSTGDTTTSSLIDADTALCLYNASRILFLTFDQCLGYIVEARIRLHDLLSWIRGTASQVRAWGTATDSIQRQNARSRRISNGVVQRVSSFLSNPMLFALKGNENGSGGGNNSADHRILTECVIGVPLSDFFVAGNPRQPSMTTNSSNKENVAANGTKLIRSLRSAVQTMLQISTILFDKPRSVFAQSFSALDICFEVKHSLMAIHTRVGAGSANVSASGGKGGDESSGFFLPRTNNEEDTSMAECPFWTLLARSLGSSIEFIAIPGCTSFEQGANDGFYLRATLMIPEGSEVTNIAFYGDDGNSSLSPNLSEESKVKEGRQSVGLVIKYNDSVSQEVKEELLLFQYDDVIFRKVESERNTKNEIIIPATNLNSEECTFLTMSDDGESVDRHVIVPKRRHIGTQRRNSSQFQQNSQVNLCGSRGTGGVITFGQSTFLNIFDMEEDDDNASSIDDDNE